LNLLDTASLEDAVQDVKRDTTGMRISSLDYHETYLIIEKDTNWCLFSYSKQANAIVFEAKVGRLAYFGACFSDEMAPIREVVATKSSWIISMMVKCR